MRTKTIAVVVLLLFVESLSRGSPELIGYTKIDKKESFSIIDTETKRSSGWISFGQSFEDYTLVAFDSEKEILSVRKGDLTLELHLKDSRVRQAEVLPLSTGERHQRLIARYARQANVAVMELRFEKDSLYITAKEVWKGTDYPVGVAIKVPRESLLGNMTPSWDGAQTKVISVGALSEMLTGNGSRIVIAAGTDGVTV